MSGHGHVTPNPNGMKARCGGPGLCSVCSAELAQKKMADEIIASRALVNELRALADEMREPVLYQRHVHPQFVDGAHSARAALLSALDSLLSAHDAQQAEGKGE